ncbi:hypothetical protein R3P38DRAFT_3374058 [Favolaschia claudopus]|uniref:Uncharacterized protein n=1 Tax=Favolaschia claudopus TaxID=2862362 RepID=A0AAV9ZPE2_9AGAR
MEANLTRLGGRFSEYVDALLDPSEADSPRTKSAWQRLLEILMGVSERIVDGHPDFLELFRGNAPLPSDDDESDSEGQHEDKTPDASSQPVQDQEPEEDGAGEQSEGEGEVETASQRKERRKAAAHGAVIKRAQKIIGVMAHGPVPARDLAAEIAEETKLVAESMEDQALGWLIRGFKNPASTWTVTLTRWRRDAAADTISFLKTSHELDLDADLLKRDINLSHSQAATRTDTYLLDLIQKMETIKFASEWTAHTGPGAGKFKSDFNTALFQREHGAIFAHLSDREKKAKMEELSVDFQLFKKSREELITSRNRLLLAYQNFGTGVLIHPFFSTKNLGQKRAKKFKSLLDVLMNLAPKSTTPNRNRFDDIEQRNRDVLYEIATALSSGDEEAEKISTHIDDFFIRYPSKVRPL